MPCVFYCQGPGRNVHKVSMHAGRYIDTQTNKHQCKSHRIQLSPSPHHPSLLPSLTSLFPPLLPCTLLPSLSSPQPRTSLPQPVPISLLRRTLLHCLACARNSGEMCHWQVLFKMMRKVWVYPWQLWIKLMRAGTVVTPMVLEILPRAVAIVTVPKGPFFGLNGLL